jgi:hypothetical protein
MHRVPIPQIVTSMTTPGFIGPNLFFVSFSDNAEWNKRTRTIGKKPLRQIGSLGRRSGGRRPLNYSISSFKRKETLSPREITSLY